MTKIANTARATKQLSIVTGTDEFQDHVNHVEITPKTKSVTWKGGTPTAILVDTIASEYELTISLAHDYQNAASLFNWMLANAGTEAEFTYMPDENAAFAATVTASVVAPPIGGAVDKHGGSTVKMPCTKPVLATLA